MPVQAIPTRPYSSTTPIALGCEFGQDVRAIENHQALQRFLVSLRDAVDRQLSVWITDEDYDPLLGLAEINGAINAGIIDLIDVRPVDALASMTSRLDDETVALVPKVRRNASHCRGWAA